VAPLKWCHQLLQKVEILIIVQKNNSVEDLIGIRKSHCIIWTTEANGVVLIDSKSFSIRPSNIITVGNKQDLELSNATIEGYFVFFEDTDFPNSSIDSVCRIVLLYNHFNMHNLLTIPEKDEQEFEQLFILIYNESRISKNSQNSILSLLLQTLLLKMELVIRQDILIDITKNTREEELLKNFLDLLEIHYTSKHKVKEYGDMMSIPTRKLNDLIKLYFGITAKDLISTKLYIEIARKLQFSSESIKEIAYQSGFSSPYHMSHFFSNMKGLSPQSYRDLLKK
jgi:AraC family transcriptional regulator, transcriptional activator of pobA